MADIFDVIADATRRDLLQLLLDRHASEQSTTGELSVGEMVEKLGISQPTVSKHLRVLRENHLVQVRDVGQHRYYSIDPEPLGGVNDWLEPFMHTSAAAVAEGPGPDLPSGTAPYGAPSAAVNDAGAAVFRAWSGAHLPAPIRRAADSWQHPADAGASLGRAAAEASHRARVVIEDAAASVQHNVVSPVLRRLHRD
ncbi:ArsR/SmtB family transcription factor [Marisediminicola senii]|uniref:ArsR/SmtB family transcription factor n=1 Tax=Marisediminicola senii TaxID=2711233 RepID=UPI0013E9E5DB